MEKIKTNLLRLFADRQIYIRSQGNVTFIALSRRTVVGMAGAALALVLWVGFASVHVLFEDEIAAQRERDVQAKHRAYETEINRLQLAYNDVTSQLSLATDWFNETTNNLEKRHNELNKVLEQHAQISSNLRDMQQTFAQVAQSNKRIRNKTELVAQAGNSGDMMMESRTATAASAPPTLQLSGASPIAALDTDKMAIPHVPDGVLTRLDRLDTRQSDLLDALEENIDVKVAQFEALIAETSILDTENFVARVLGSDARASGGPYIPLPGASDLSSHLHRQLYRISNNLNRLEDLSKSVTQVPFALPIHDYRLTSTFGARVDPFTQRTAFHSGVDFGTAAGTPVYATLPGTVVRTGLKGPYGLVVELDHGNGFRTRYGHLGKSHVKRGQYIGFQEHIADAGSSGRSTGPHLHYEIWYDGKVKDPAGFLNAGKQIFNIAEAIKPTTSR
jgi:murein DD-endopeptidase MepM/ murein hydrolase activator NlpD